MNNLTVSRQQYNELVAALAICQASPYPAEITALVFTAAAKGIVGAEMVDSIMARGGRVDGLTIVDENSQTHTMKLGGRTVVMRNEHGS